MEEVIKKEEIKEIVKKPPLKKIRRSFSIFSCYLGEKIDLKKLQEGFKKYTYITRDQPIVLKLDTGQYAVLTKFGVVTFWNVPKNVREEFIQEISQFVEKFEKNYPYFDTLQVFTGKEIEDVKFGKVYLTKIDKEKVQVISFVISQSVALERFEKEIEQRVSELERLIEILKSEKIRILREKELLKEIGDILTVRQSTISHLSLFDKPEMTWEREELERLYNKLFYEFELGDRFDILNEKIKFLSDHNKLLLDLIFSKRGQFLELIIAVLLFIEVLIFLGEVFFLIR
jgi:uncharacterized Rmd1/YagE family protein